MDGSGKVSSPIDDSARWKKKNYKSQWNGPTRAERLAFVLQRDTDGIEPEGKSRAKTPGRRRGEPQPRKCPHLHAALTHRHVFSSQRSPGDDLLLGTAGVTSCFRGFTLGVSQRLSSPPTVRLTLVFLIHSVWFMYKHWETFHCPAASRGRHQGQLHLLHYPKQTVYKCTFDGVNLYSQFFLHYLISTCWHSVHQRILTVQFWSNHIAACLCCQVPRNQPEASESHCRLLLAVSECTTVSCDSQSDQEPAFPRRASRLDAIFPSLQDQSRPGGPVASRQSQDVRGRTSRFSRQIIFNSSCGSGGAPTNNEFNNQLHHWINNNLQFIGPVWTVNTHRVLLVDVDIYVMLHIFFCLLKGYVMHVYLLKMNLNMSLVIHFHWN